MAGYRIDRITEDIKRELIAILREVKDPRVSGMLTVVKVDVSNDLSYAKVYISALEGVDKAKEAVKGLKAAQGFIRGRLGSSLHLRKTPELRFVAEWSVAEIARTMGLTEGTVKTRIFRGRKLLMERLREEGYLDGRAYL